MHWLTAQHLHAVDWPIQPKSCSKPGTGTLSVYSWYITTAERTEQISEKQESFTEQDNRARRCLINREWHVVIRVGVLPWASYHLGELWKRAGRDLIPVVQGSVAWKSVRFCEQAKRKKSAVKRETEDSEREEAEWEMRGEGQFQHERSSSTHGSPRSVCGRLRVFTLLALWWRPQSCKALGCYQKSPTCLSPVLLVFPPVLTQRCVLGEGCMKPTLLEELLLGGSTNRATITSEKQDKSLAHLREGFKLSLTKWFPWWDRPHSCQEQLQVRL